jgi:autotransporter-associated beta strand protein
MKSIYPEILIAALSIGTAYANAETVTQLGTMSAGQSWLNGIYFSDGLPAHSGADYVLDTLGWRMRTPADGDYTFPGDSLTISNGAEFMFKIPNHTSTEPPIDASFEIANLAFVDAKLTHGGNTNFGKAALTGGISVTGTLTIDTFQWERAIQIDSVVSGTGTILVWQSTGNKDGRGVVSFTNAANTFSGDLEVLTSGTLDLDYDAANFAHLELDGKLIVDQALTFDTLSIHGTTVAAGTYAPADLQAAFPGAIEAGEGGSITVSSAADPTWAGLPVVDGWVTSDNYGFLYVDTLPWVYIAEKAVWVYLPPANFAEGGFWNFMLPSAP